MTKRLSTATDAVLVAIDMSKHRQEVLVERPEGGRRRRMTVLATKPDYDCPVEYLAAIGRPILVGFEATGNYHRTLALIERFPTPASITALGRYAFRRPVDAGIPLLLIRHGFSLFAHVGHRSLRRSLYWRSEGRLRLRRELPTGHRSRPTRRGTCPPSGHATGGNWSLPANRLGSGRYARSGRHPRSYASFRYAPLHCAQPRGVHHKEPHEKRYREPALVIHLIVGHYCLTI